MSVSADDQFERFSRIADAKFTMRTAGLYDVPIRTTHDLRDSYQNEGIASLPKYVRKTAELVGSAFGTIEPTILEIYVEPLIAADPTYDVERLLITKIGYVMEREILRGQDMIENLCSAFVGNTPSRYSIFVAKIANQGRQIQMRLDTMVTSLLRSQTKHMDRPVSETPPSVLITAEQKKPLLIFISHSSEDRQLAELLIHLLRDALLIKAKEIRCTSVDGYRLPAGEHAETALRDEVNTAKVLVGLITKQSLSSSYVLFELGARWGAKLPLFPVLAGVKASALRGPLSALNALNCDNPADLHQLITDLGNKLVLVPERPHVYNGSLLKVTELATAFKNEKQIYPAESIMAKIKPSAIVHATYETTGQNAERVSIFIRPSDSSEGTFTFETTLGDETQGGFEDIADVLTRFDKNLSQKGFKRMQYGNFSGNRLFDL